MNKVFNIFQLKSGFTKAFDKNYEMWIFWITGIHNKSVPVEVNLSEHPERLELNDRNEHLYQIVAHSTEKYKLYFDERMLIRKFGEDQYYWGVRDSFPS